MHTTLNFLHYFFDNNQTLASRQGVGGMILLFILEI